MKIRNSVRAFGRFTLDTRLAVNSARMQSAGLRRITNTSEEGVNINPSISGDGKIITFESTEDIAGAGGSDPGTAAREAGRTP